jgi:hypothetical protein
MTYTYNPFTDNLDYYENYFRGVLASAPSNPQNGWTYINSGDSGYYIYYAGWNLIVSLAPPTASYFLLETGDVLLLETGDKLELEV